VGRATGKGRRGGGVVCGQVHVWGSLRYPRCKEQGHLQAVAQARQSRQWRRRGTAPAPLPQVEQAVEQARLQCRCGSSAGAVR
jgi:hypothetical protein